MRRLSLAVALGLGVVAFASTSALAFSDETVTAHVPFAFHLGRQSFPAGDYRITPLGTLQQRVLLIRTADGRHPTLVMTLPSNPGSDNGRPELVFDKVGQQEFLRAVQVPPEEGSVVPTSRTEIRAETQMALHQPADHQAVHTPRS